MRVDAAKHIPANELHSIKSRAGRPLYFNNEVGGAGTGRVAEWLAGWQGRGLRGNELGVWPPDIVKAAVVYRFL